MDTNVSTLSRQRGRTRSPLTAAPSGAAPAGIAAPLPAARGATHGRRRSVRERLLRKASILSRIVPAALPLFDVSVAALQSLDELRSAVAEDMVLASTLHVPGHHLLACRAEAFGTPFSAPPLQTLESADSLGEDAKQFAACLAAPPDAEEAAEGAALHQRLARMASMINAIESAPSFAAQPSVSLLTINNPEGVPEAARRALVRSSTTEQRRAAQPGSGAHGLPQPGSEDLGTDPGPWEQGRGALPQLQPQHSAAAAAAAGQVMLQAREGSEGHALREAFEEFEGGDAVAVQPARPHTWLPAPAPLPLPLLAACHDVAAALVGVGALLLRGFESRTELARGLVERRAAALLRLGSGRLARTPGITAFLGRSGSGAAEGGAAEEGLQTSLRRSAAASGALVLAPQEA